MGNKIDLDTAIELTNMIVTKEDHIPVLIIQSEILQMDFGKI
ncbi:hypothetical protein [Pseudobutyrivibrio sp.]|nr:hypothetical protein [Pseudobutyrivibrio sp.]